MSFVQSILFVIAFNLLFGVPLKIIECDIAERRNGSGNKLDTIEVSITMDDYEFEPDTLRLEAYDVIVLTFINRGSVAHGFAAGEFVSAANDGFNRSMFEDVKVRKTVGSQTDTIIPEKSRQLHDAMITLDPEETGRLVFTLPNENAGVWWMGCFESSGEMTHYQLGMTGLVLVKPK